MKYFLPLFLTAIAFRGLAQTEAAHTPSQTVRSQLPETRAQSKGALTLSVGPAIPLGNFASNNAYSTSAGLANPGVLADLSYQHPTHNSQFSWTATLRGRINGVSKNATEAPFEARFPGYQWSMNNSRWTTAAVLLGGIYKLPLTPKLSLTINLELGVAECWSPKQNITGIRDSAGFGPRDLVQGYLHSVSATTFTALAGVGVCYKLQSRWSLLARADYSWLRPIFPNVNAVIIWSQGLRVPGVLSPANASVLSAYSTTHYYTQEMPTLDITIGVARAL